MASFTHDEQLALLRVAGRMTPAYARILAIGPDRAAVESFLPVGCVVETANTLPTDTAADLVILLSQEATAVGLAAAADRCGRPFVCAWSAEDSTLFNLADLTRAMADAGFSLQCGEQIAPTLGLFKWVRSEDRPNPRSRRVLVLSHFHISNFGDRLGYHVLNRVLPAEAEVAYGALNPWNVPDGDYDLLILGIGNSLLPKDAANPRLLELVERIPRAIGIFGTQFREQYFRYRQAAGALDFILNRVTTWWARYEEDILAFGRGRDNVRHLGDWLIAASPLTRPIFDKGLTIEASICEREVALDRFIQQVQSYRHVTSGRLHPLVAALPSAANVSYHEQRYNAHNPADPTGEGATVSGKFRSLLYDVFGRTFEEAQFFPVDRNAVIAYKRKVEANMEALRADLFNLLGCTLPRA